MIESYRLSADPEPVSNPTSVKPLRVADEAFLVASTIERCPKTMMLRELVMNGLEAARDGADPKRVELRPVVIDGTRKLAIWNSGPGLLPSELDRICDLASTLRKVSSLDGNFGMGAKVASLPSNRHGMLIYVQKMTYRLHMPANSFFNAASLGRSL